jgi:mRNA interferase MazF
LKGKIVLITFPFTDLTAKKLRPALVLHEDDKDVIVVFISSRIAKASSNDVLIKKDQIEFKQTGLKVDSFIKIEKIATLSKRLIVGEIGQVGSCLKKEINQKIRQALEL